MSSMDMPMMSNGMAGMSGGVTMGMGMSKSPPASATTPAVSRPPFIPLDLRMSCISCAETGGMGTHSCV